MVHLRDEQHMKIPTNLQKGFRVANLWWALGWLFGWKAHVESEGIGVLED
jgi:hypothetical protein